MKAILEEAIDQEFVEKNPARKGDSAKRTAARKQGDVDLGPTPVGASFGIAPGPHSVDIGHDRDVPAERAIRAPLEQLRHGWENANRQPDSVPGKTARLRKDQKVDTKRACPGKVSERPVALAAGVPESRGRWVIFPNSRKRNGATRNGFIRTDNYRAPVC